MEEGSPFYLALSDVLFSLLSLISFLVDVMLDLWAVQCLYEEENYVCMGLLICLLLGSSALVQIFSWLWYSDSSVTPETKVDKFVNRHGLLALVHICQLGVFLRFAAVTEISTWKFKKDVGPQKRVAMYLRHDLSMLRLFEAFSESAPQLVLMMALIIQMQELQSFTVIKIIGSLSALTFSALSYHRNMREFIHEKQKTGWPSSVMYFLWNLFLIGSRVVTISLFASILPCYVIVHFLSLWILLVLWAWWQKTDFMESKAGEWLYRATVGLIWYFSWFNVASGNTKLKRIIYHMVIGADTMLLLGLWWWSRSVESARFEALPINPYILIAMLMIMYIIGVLLKLVYYWKFHPDKPDLQMNMEDDEPDMKPVIQSNIERYNVPVMDMIETPETEPKPESQRIVTGIHKRIRNMAVNFYS